MLGTVRVASLNPFAHLARRAEPDAGGDPPPTTATATEVPAPAPGTGSAPAPAPVPAAAAPAPAPAIVPTVVTAAARDIPDDGDEASDRADELDPVARAVRQRERGRIRAIMLSDAGKDHPDIAMVLALGPMSRRQAIDMVQAMASIGAAKTKPAETLRTRMDAVDIPAVGSEGGKEMTPTQMIVLAGKIRRGEKID